MRKQGCVRTIGLGVLLLLALNVLLTWRAQQAADVPFFSELPQRPLVIAHQGGEHLRPSNTMLAFAHAAELRVDVLEMDIHATQDGVLVTIHDETVDRTTDGVGLVREMDSAELRQLDAGHYWTNDDGQTYPYRGQGVAIATLDEVFTVFPDMRMNIEIKQVEPPIAADFCELLRRYNRTHITLVASFHQEALDQFRAACPDTPTSLTAGEVTNFYARSRLFAAQTYSPPAAAIQIPEASAGFELLTPRFVAAAQRRNLQVHAWTINDPDEMLRMLALGVDGIITDRPDLLLDLLNR